MIFTLLIEFVNLSWDNYNLEKIQKEINQLEVKHKSFLDGNQKVLSIEEISFFEASRNSVNEKKNRDLRAKIIKDILANSINS